MTATATWPLQKAIAAALVGRSQLAALLAGNKVHSGRAPQDAPLDYIVLDDTQEGRKDVFQNPGHTGVESGSIYTADLSKRSGQLIYAQIVLALDDVVLAVEGHHAVWIRVQYVTDFEDQDRLARHFVWRCLVESLVGS